MPLPSSLETKLLRFSVSPSDGEVAVHAEEIVVLAFAPECVEAGFARAKSLVDAGASRVRLIGPAVTLERSWPSWIRNEERIVLTEHGAFNHTPFAVSTRALDRDLRAWFDTVFAGAFEGRPSDVLYTSACARFLQTSIATYPIARALADAFPRGRFVCMDGGFHTINGGFDPDLFTGVITSAGGTVEWATAQPPSGSTALWAARVASLGVAALGGSLLQQLKEYVLAAPSRKELRRRRRNAAPPVDVWVTVVPDWLRANGIAVDAFARPALEEGKRLGLLLIGTLRPGMRDESNMKKNRASDDLWPGLSALRAHLDDCVVEQVVLPERLVGLARALSRGTRASANAIARVARKPSIDLPDVSIDLTRHAWQFVALATLDVLRGTLVEEASRELVGRYDFAGKVVVVSASSMASNAAADLALQRSGALTLNSPDGSGSDIWTGVGSTVSSARSVWTYSDARSIGDTCKHVIVAGMPPGTSQPRRSGPRKNILVLNNHGHREFFVNGVFRERLFQEELLDVVRELRELGQHDLRFRWRPHPAAAEESIAHGMGRLRDVELSRGVPLDADATWADLVICGYSTSIIQLIAAGLPVFVQVRPEMVGLPALDFLAPERAFFDAREGARKIAACIDAFERGDVDALAAEAAARIALFGPTGVPLPSRAALDDAAALTREARRQSEPAPTGTVLSGGRVA